MRKNKSSRGRSKNYTDAVLLDIYGELIKPENRELLDLYYNEDHSLAEVAENYGSSRQAVQQSIARSMMKLKKYEKALKLTEIFSEIEVISGKIEEAAKKHNDPELQKIAKELTTLIDK